MSPEKFSSCEALRYGKAETMDGNPPLCGEFVAWRHPRFGNYTPGELSYEVTIQKWRSERSAEPMLEISEEADI